MAGVMLGVGLTAIFSSFATFAALAKTTDRMTTATAIANGLLEDFAVDSTIDARLAGAGGSYLADDFGRDSGSGSYTVSWDVTPGPITELKRVDVTVRWTTTVRQHHVTFFTYVRGA